MPVVGFIGADGEPYPFEEALRLAAEGDEAFPYPYPLIKGIVDNTQQRGDYISVTSLLHCLRADYLKRRTDYYLSVEQAYPMFRGTLFHSLMEQNPNPNGEIEQKVVRKYKGIELGGTFDSKRIVKKSGRTILEDWKTTKSLPKYGAYTSHIQQVNIYRWLLELDPDTTDLIVHYFSMEGHKACPLKRGGRNPQVWSDERVEKLLDSRLLVLRASMDAEIPVPYSFIQEDEKWECDYCPVRQRCHDIAELERENGWRKRAGLDVLPVMSSEPVK